MRWEAETWYLEHDDRRWAEVGIDWPGFYVIGIKRDHNRVLLHSHIPDIREAKRLGKEWAREEAR